MKTKKQPLQSAARTNLIGMLWGLLFTKCFVLEFLVRTYQVPINSLVYVWSLSLFMATVATAVYFNLHKNGLQTFLHSSDFLAFTLFGIAVFSLSFIALTDENATGSYALTLVGLILAIKHAYIRMRSPNAKAAKAARAATPANTATAANTTTALSPRWLTFGWLISAILCTSVGSPDALLVFALSLVALTVFPRFQRFLKFRRI